MIEKNGVKLFGYFKGMVYTKYKNKDLEEDFEKYKTFKNAISKEKIIKKKKKDCIMGVSPMQSLDIFTGEDLTAGQYEDGPFRFPTDFLHYLKKYDIGIPYEYEEYLSGILQRNE